MNQKNKKVNLSAIKIEASTKFIMIYLVAWLLPLIITSLISESGYNFSLVGEEWQQINKSEAFLSILTAGSVYCLACLLIYKIYKLVNIAKKIDSLDFELDYLRQIYLIIITAISGYGLYRSFGGNLLQKIYNGTTEVWLNYGAWGVTYSLSLLLLMFKNFHNKPLIFFMALTVLFTPILFCGSRIDYLSCIITLVVYLSYKKKIMQTIIILLLTFTIIAFVGKARYIYGAEELQNNQYASILSYKK